MKRMYRIEDDYDYENYNQREHEDKMLERAFKEGCEYGYKMAMRESEGYSERKPHSRDDFEERIARLKRRYE